MGIKELAKRLLEEKENRRYEKLLRQRRVSYGGWAAAIETGQEARGGDASHDFVIFRAGKGYLAPGASGIIGAYFAAHPEVQLLYGDEDVCDGLENGVAVGRRLPWYKPDWSPDCLDSFFYFGSVVAMRRALLEKAGVHPEDFSVPGEDGAGSSVCHQVTDFAAYEQAMHSCAEAAGGYGKGAYSVGHVGRILFHVESEGEQKRFLEPTPFLEDLKRRRLRDFRKGMTSPQSRERAFCPVLSVVIPSRDHPGTLESCLKGCLTAAKPCGLPFEAIVVDNGSTEENRERVECVTQRLSDPKNGCRIRYLYRPMEFNFSRMCNLGASEAEGRLLLFLNDDVELCQAGTFEQMASLAARDWTGAVGLKLYYPDSLRIQHAGITNLPMGPVHKLQFLEDDRCYYYGANQGSRNVLAVTAACLMVDRDKFREAGRFSEDLRVAFNDVDFCFHLYEAGYQNVCMNGIYGYHHESLSRGDDESEEKLARLLGEREKLYRAHPHLEGKDPYYSLWLSREGLDTGIRPAYLTAGNVTQKAFVALSAGSVAGYRQDACLMVRVEDCRGRRALGYGVVLGDTNACYDRWLLLQKEEGPKVQKPEEGDLVYRLDLEGMYRPDLEENMSDQRNVALCGFDVEIGEAAIPTGRYRLGMAVRNRITGLRLLNWSNRFVEL